jgi:hypothetical protein
MNTATFNAVSEAANIAEQNAMPANAGQTDSTAIDHAQAKRERKAKKTAKAALHNAEQGHDNSKLGRRKTRYAKSQFPFLRLPAEVRNRVVQSNLFAQSYSQDIPLTSTFCARQYQFAVKSSGRCNIKTFQQPPLLKVCQQIRSEASGLFTAVNGFDISVRTNYVPFVEDKAKTPLYPAYFHDLAGLLQLDASRREWLEGEKIVFRNVFISVYGAHACMNFVGFFGIGDNINKDDKYAVKFSVTNNRQNLEHVGKMFSDIKVDIEKVLSEAKARPGFAGLTFSDLEKIAKFFNYIKGE